MIKSNGATVRNLRLISKINVLDLAVLPGGRLASVGSEGSENGVAIQKSGSTAYGNNTFPLAPFVSSSTSSYLLELFSYSTQPVGEVNDSDFAAYSLFGNGLD